MIDSWDVSPTKAGWAVAGLVVSLIVAYAVYTLIGAVVLGIFLYYATRPAYRWLNDRIDHPHVNATLTLLLIGVPILLVLAYATFVGLRELDQLLGQAGLERLRTAIAPYVDIASLTDPAQLVSRLDSRVPQILGFVGAALTWVLRLFVAFTIAFYLLRDDAKIGRWLRHSFHDEHEVISFLRGVDEDLVTIYVGNLLTIGATTLIAVAVYYGLDFLAPAETGVPFPLLLGLLTGVGTLIPAVGMKIVYVPYTGFLVWRSVAEGAGPLWFPVVFFLVTLLVIDSFPDIIIRSYISSGTINMGLIMLGYVLGAFAFGWYGVFLAPIILVVFLHFAHRVFPNLLDPAETRLVSDDWP